MNRRRKAFNQGMNVTNEGLTLYDIGKRYDDAHISGCIQTQEIMSQVNEWLKDPQGFLILRGNPGTGKTHLAMAIYHLMEEGVADTLEKNKMNPDDAWKFFHLYSEHHYLSEMKGFWGHEGSNSSGRRIQKICEVPTLIFDDLGTTNIQYPWQRDLIQELINTRYNNCEGATIITTNFNNEELRDMIDAKTVDRMNEKGRCTILEMFGDSRRASPEIFQGNKKKI